MGRFPFGAALLCSLLSGTASAQAFTQPGIAITGPGYTTAYYIDPFGKRCGVGMKSTGEYPVTNNIPTLGTSAFYTMGDMADADPASSTICTSAQWAAVSWDGSGNTWQYPSNSTIGAADNALMLAFLKKEKSYSSLAASPPLYYISQSTSAFLPAGNDTTCASGGAAIPNRPDIPCLSTKPVLTALEATGQTFAGNVTGSGTTVTVNSTSQGVLAPGTVITGTGYPSSDAVVRQLNGTQYLMTKSATVSAESVTGANLQGGAILIGGGTWSNGGDPLYFTAAYGGTPSWLISGSQGYPLYIGAFPGQVVLDESTDGSGNAISVVSVSYSPGANDSDVVIDGLQLLAPNYGDGNGIKAGHVTRWKIENVEVAGYDDAFLLGPVTRDITVEYNVCHDVNHHCVYFDYGDPYANYEGQGAAGGDFDFALDQRAYNDNATYGCAFSGQATMTSAGSSSVPNTITVTAVTSGSLCYGTLLTDTTTPSHLTSTAYVDGQLSGTAGGIGTYVVAGVNATVGTAESITGDPVACQTIYGCGASYGAKVLHNVMYGNGNSGYEPIHLNDYLDGARVDSNVVSFSGGNCLALQTGVYNAQLNDNICFDNGRNAVALVIGLSDVPSTLRWIDIDGNIFWENDGTNSIRGAGTGAAAAINQGVSYGTTGYGIPSAVGHWIKNVTIANNILDGYFNATSANAALEFGSPSSPVANNAYPESDTVSGNDIWSTYSGNPPNYVMIISANSSVAWAAGTYPFSGGSACNSSAVESLSQCYPSGANAFADPGFVSALSSNWLNPGSFNFSPHLAR